MADDNETQERAALQRQFDTQKFARPQTMRDVYEAAGTRVLAEGMLAAASLPVGSIGTGSLAQLGAITAAGSGVFIATARQEAEVNSLKRDLMAATDQIATMQKQVAALQEQLTKDKHTEQNQNFQAEVASIAQVVNQLQARIEGAQKQTEVLTAPVLIPTPEDM